MVHVYIMPLHLGGKTGECSGLVPQSPGLRLLVVRHRRGNTDVEPAVPGALGGHRGGPHKNNVCREGQPRLKQTRIWVYTTLLERMQIHRKIN